jgi:hypothetical protein
MRCSYAIAIALSLAACRAATSPRAPDGDAASVTAELRAHTQALLDAVAVGDRAVWDRLLDPAMIYVSEAGAIQTKAALLAELEPLPPGLSGSIAIGRFDVTVYGDTAVVVHLDHESMRYHGHPLASDFLTTHVWRRGPGGWRLVAAHVHAALVDPPAVALPPAQLDEYVGRYRLTDALTYEIRRDGDGLVGQRSDRPAQVLAAEARDVFFVPGQPRSRKVFQRDAAGRITGFADRREGHDIPWARLP